jgi:hypothetical protein
MSSEPQWPSVETIRQILDSRQEEIDPLETVEVMFGASGKDPDDFGYQWGSPDFMGSAYHYAWQVTTSIDAKSNCQAVAEWVVDQWNEYDIRSDSASIEDEDPRDYDTHDRGCSSCVNGWTQDDSNGVIECSHCFPDEMESRNGED